MEEKIIDLVEVYRKLKMIEKSMVTKKELESALDSVIVLSNDETMAQIEGSEKDVSAGRVRKIGSVKDI